jgi:hypothetical protein
MVDLEARGMTKGSERRFSVRGNAGSDGRAAQNRTKRSISRMHRCIYVMIVDSDNCYPLFCLIVNNIWLAVAWR